MVEGGRARCGSVRALLCGQVGADRKPSGASSQAFFQIHTVAARGRARHVPYSPRVSNVRLEREGPVLEALDPDVLDVDVAYPFTGGDLEAHPRLVLIGCGRPRRIEAIDGLIGSPQACTMVMGKE